MALPPRPSSRSIVYRSAIAEQKASRSPPKRSAPPEVVIGAPSLRYRLAAPVRYWAGKARYWGCFGGLASWRATDAATVSTTAALGPRPNSRVRADETIVE